jgi:predicted NBD/HSP70 family sugar kinase/mannose-6-phosphate isomerase class I
MFIHIDKEGVIGVDIGGSHISAAWVDAQSGAVMEETLCTHPIDASGSSLEVIRAWAGAIRATLNKLPGSVPLGIGIAMPGPFDYLRGISRMSGLHKYDHLLGVNVRQALRDELDTDLPLLFENDAACFGLGECYAGKAAGYHRVIALTLGTGIGSAFILDGQVCRTGPGIPPDGYLYAVPFRDGIAEDYISTHAMIRTYVSQTGKTVEDVEALAAAARENDRAALVVFSILGDHLRLLLEPWIRDFGAECLVLGGSITRAASLFLPALLSSLSASGLDIPVHLSEQTELAALAGAAALVTGQKASSASWRRSSQSLLPLHPRPAPDSYDLYPFHRLRDGHIHAGYDTLAAWIMTHKRVLIDGYGGNDWDAIRERLGTIFRKAGKKVVWYEMTGFQKPEEEILALTDPFVGATGSVWGRRTDLNLGDFLRLPDLEKIRTPVEGYDCMICLGIGSALVPWDAPVLYIDLPKNEIQYRMRAGVGVNLGLGAANSPTEAYKRCYFVDWIVLNRHRVRISDRVAVIADGQWKDDITWAPRESLSEGLRMMTTGSLRVRPWFEAGAWGGQWLKARIPELPQDEVNYAWSFELIVPENGLVFESSGNLLEIAFDWLMEQEALAVLGKDAARFGSEFPIRFDFLDTFDGGNLSIQCHPSLEYIREQFGERITQDETYYILDCAEDAGVYLGFQGDIDPQTFRDALETSAASGTEVDITRFVQWHPSHRHDLFLIPNKTIHSSGANNLVLEISATPYIYTFKMYDWLRMDLNGEPRPINIAHAFRNLDFDRQGERVQRELLSRPVLLEERPDYKLTHLPTHPDHFYDVHRLEFSGVVVVPTNEQCHVLMLVEGTALWVETPKGGKKRFHFAETFVIPAAAGSYSLRTDPGASVKVVKAFIK